MLPVTSVMPGGRAQLGPVDEIDGDWSGNEVRGDLPRQQGPQARCRVRGGVSLNPSD